ncbi:MAG: beta-lactamase family protein [Cyclobacteriaceae bacterium]|nr:beta-lactamase family protein [Cyclobacteriaceae bacterium]
MSVAVMNAEQVYIHHIQGLRIKNSHEFIEEDDYFHIGSCSKSILAILAGKLIEQRKLSWGTRFFDLYPELKSSSRPEYHSITLEDLLTCEAGIRGYTTDKEFFPPIDSNALNKRYEFAKWLLGEEPISKVDETGKFRHLYSNAGYTLAALILEAVADSSWEELIIQMMNELNLRLTFGFPTRFNPQQPWGHGYFEFDTASNTAIERKTLQPFAPDNAYRLNELIAPAGDLSMPALDFAKYTQLHLQGLTGVDKYLQKQTWNHIHFFRSGFSIGVGNSMYYGKQITGFDGSAGTFYCRSIIVPTDNFAFTIMINAGSQNAVDWVTAKLVKKYYNWWWKVWL